MDMDTMCMPVDLWYFFQHKLLSGNADAAYILIIALLYFCGGINDVCLLVGVYNNSELPPPIAFGPIRGTTHVYYTYLAFSRVQVGFTANSVYL